jgi:dTDP-glucose 4,6-dehydratase
VTRVLITGAAGLVGSHLIEHLLTSTDWDITAVDLPGPRRHTAWLARHREWKPRLTVIAKDLAETWKPLAPVAGAADYVIVLASDTDVERSIASPAASITANTAIALATLEYCRQVKPRAVIWMSSGEVHGPELATGPHQEWAPILPPSPYAAGKAAQEAIATAYWRTYGVPVAIACGAGFFGERQPARKFIPSVIRAVLAGEAVKIYGTPQDPGGRHYLHCRAVASALQWLLTTSAPAMAYGSARPDRWNVTGPEYVSNTALAERIAVITGRGLHCEFTGASIRPGHEQRYGLDGGKLATAGWKPPESFEKSLEHTVRWYLANPQWLGM